MAQKISNLPLGAKIKYGKHSINGETQQDLIWLVVAKNHQCTPAYPANSVTLFAEKIIDFRCFDANESGGSADRQTYGNNRYSLSNIDQWLNKDNAANAWFVATHSADVAPDAGKSYLKAYYNSRPAFLYFFSASEKNAILPTTIRTYLPTYDGGGIEDVSRKMFLPSTDEITSSSIGEGSQWEYFKSNSPACICTNQASTNSKVSPVGSATGEFWCRRCDTNTTHKALFYRSDVTSSFYMEARSERGIRPAFNLSSTLTVSDTTDADGCYTIVWNSAPSTPVTLNVPSTVYGGKTNTISWSPVTDPNGDAVTYQLECSINGGAYTQIYSGAALSYAHLIPFGTPKVNYRVKASDPLGESSAYITSATLTVVNNNAPVISGADGNLGVKDSGFTGKYTVTDANNNAVTVTEAIDGVRIRSLVATLGEEITYGVRENTWLALPNGSHTLTISATDGIDTSVRTYVFTKLVDALKIQNATPWAASTMPSRIMLVVTRNVPSTATFKVEVCNNGNDASPTWEDATDAVTSGLVHVFSNKSKTATNWGVLVRVTVERNGATGACYVSAIGGNFE